MKDRVLPRIRRTGGQTLVIALIVLGVLLLLGFVFLGIIDNSLHSQAVSQSNSQATDLAEAGIRDAHSRMLTSELGADYRGTPSLTYGANNAVSSTDPDLFYLRPGTGMPIHGPSVTATDHLLDQGGPDGLGPFVRYNYSTGRALVRIRYAPSDADLFVSSPVGPLRNPGAARDYLIIESVGRIGRVNPNDPTTLNTSGGIQYSGYPDWPTFHTAFLKMQQANGEIATSRRLIAMQSIGITEQALFISNKDNVNRPAEIGIPSALGAYYTEGTTGTTYYVGSNPDFPNGTGAHATKYGGVGLSVQIGSQNSFPNTQGQQVANMSAGGGIRSNADLKIYGNVATFLNQSLGDGIDVAGSIIPEDTPDGPAQLVVDASHRDGNGNWVDSGQTILSDTSPVGSFSTTAANYNTLNGLVRDGLGNPDQFGFPRSVGREEPPSISVVDPATGENRYVQMTRDSGIEVNGVNSGNYGYGRGVYVDNFGDRQNPSGEQGRQDVGSQQSLVFDWLNPNNGQSGSGWQGPFYIPAGAYVQLLRDGFVIQRDSRDSVAQRFWRNPNGSSTGTSTIRYRVGIDPQGTLRILSSFANPTLDMTANLQPTDFANGFPFNGVLYFEGNVRVRGTIPTDVQLMMVSNATIYVEGSILKGDVETEVTAAQDSNTIGAVIHHAPKATLMLAAKDYVAINTPNFFGPTPGQSPQPVDDVANDEQYKPLDLQLTQPSQTLEFIHEFVMQTQPSTQLPGINASDPGTYMPFAISYTDSVNLGSPIVPALTLSHTMATGPAAVTFAQLLINYQGLASAPGNAPLAAYEFPTTSADYPFGPVTNYAVGFGGFNGPNLPTWGLGGDLWQQYPKFEADSFPLNAVGTGALSADGLTIAPAPGASPNPNQYTLYTREANDFLIQAASFTGTPTNDYYLSRVFVTPDDIKIEASMYAEEGSFFVIPGPWMNPNPNDRHDLYTQLGNNPDEQARARLENFGSNPLFPFYGEPPDIRVTINGAISENMPVPIGVQAEWIRKWGWIPNHRGSDTTDFIPIQHVPNGYLASRDAYVPNLIINYDPVLATASNAGYTAAGPGPGNIIRTDQFGRVLPPIPRLPVSPSLAYFGEVN